MKSTVVPAAALVFASVIATSAEAQWLNYPTPGSPRLPDGVPPGREFVVIAAGDLLFVQGLNEPKLPLLVQSETHFMSTATPTGFEFVRDAQGRVTHLIVRGAAGELKAVRRAAASSAPGR